MHPRNIVTAGWLLIFLALFTLQTEYALGETQNISTPVSRIHKVDINKASALEIATIPGLGARKSEAIVEYRKVHGPFKTVEELKNVSGIGDRLLQRIRAYIKIGSENSK